MAEDVDGTTARDESMFDVAAVVDAVFLCLLDRPADPSGRAAFTGALAGGHMTLLEMISEISGVAEAERVLNRRVTGPMITALYEGILNRPPREEDLVNWSAEIERGLSFTDAVRIIDVSEEAQIQQLHRITNSRGVVAVLQAEQRGRDRLSAER